MNCPKCNNEMQPGYLQTGNLIAFNKQRHKLSLNSDDPKDVMIARKAFSSNDYGGYICKACGLVVLDLVAITMSMLLRGGEV